MIGAIILAMVLFGLHQPLLSILKKKHDFIDVRLLNGLYVYHLLFWLIYYLYSRSNRSDSNAYFERSSNISDWLASYAPGTRFISFIAHPFTNVGFNYEMMMLLFSWFGFIGFIYFYVFFKENNRTPVKFLGYNLITVLLFLPNMHFWTASLGKGSLIFMGLGMFAYAMRKPQQRLIVLILGSLIIFNVRLHVFLFAGLGAVIGYFTSNEKVPIYQKILVYVAFVGAIVMFYSQILAVANLNESDVVGSFEDFATQRANGLSTSGSGLNINGYPLIFKLLTFWFRPLFVDAPGALGIFVSVENLVYLMLFFKLFNRKFFNFLIKSSSMVKMSGIIFITSSVALSFVMSNLGIATRQKSMVMYFLFFVVLSFLSNEERIRRAKIMNRRALLAKRNEQTAD